MQNKQNMQNMQNGYPYNGAEKCYGSSIQGCTYTASGDYLCGKTGFVDGASVILGLQGGATGSSCTSCQQQKNDNKKPIAKSASNN